MLNKEILLDYFADISDMNTCQLNIDENLIFKYNNIEYKSLKVVYDKFKRSEKDDIILEKYQRIFIKTTEMSFDQWKSLNNRIFSILTVLLNDNSDIKDIKISTEKSCISIHVYYENLIINDSKNLFTKMNKFNKEFENKFAIGYNKKGELIFMNNFHLSMKPFVNPKKDIDFIKNSVLIFLNENFIYENDKFNSIFNRYSTVLEPKNKSDIKYIKDEITQL